MTHAGRRSFVKIVVAMAAVALVAGVAVVPAGAGTAAAKTPTKIGKGEGRLDLVAWEGYVESGQNSPDANWVQPFEQETGCTVHVTYKPTSDEMVTAMESGGGGQYDGVSASGDASNRLIADGTVAPVNVKLLKNFKNIAPNLQSPPNNTVGGKHYGPSFMWGGNVLLYNTSKVTPKPDSWSIVFDKNTPYAGSLTAYDGPIYIADAALYLKATQPSLGIKDPYELTQKQFDAAVQLLKDQHPNIKKYWGLISDEIDTFASGEVVAGQSWPYQVVALQARRQARRLRGAQGGDDRLVGHLDDLVQGQAPELHVQVDGLHVAPRRPGLGRDVCPVLARGPGAPAARWGRRRATRST